MIRGLSALPQLTRAASSVLTLADPQAQARKDARWVKDWDDEDVFSSGSPSRIKRAAHAWLVGEEARTQGSLVEVVVDPRLSSLASSPDPPAAASDVPARAAPDPCAAPRAADVKPPPPPPPPPPTWFEILTTDPIARLFAYAPAAWGNVSYGQYVLQMICYQVWPVDVFDVTLIPFMVFLLASSWLSAELCTIPARSWWLGQKEKPLKLWAWPVLTAFLLIVMGVPYAHRRRDDSVATAAPFVQIAPDAIDVKLNWTAAPFDDEPAGRSIINPSLLLTPPDGEGSPRLIRAARAHGLGSTRGEGTWVDDESGATVIVTELTTVWYSDIVTALEPLASAHDLDGWGDSMLATLDGSAALLGSATGRLSSSLTLDSWGPLCEPEPRYVPANYTLFKKTVSGPEDPKLLHLPDGSAAMTFSSLPPAESRPGCHQAQSAVVQMYLAPLASGPNASAEPSVGMRLQCGESTTAEKNWIGFSHSSWANQLFYIYSIHPHVVVQARAPDGACVQRYSTSSYQPLAKLSEAGTHRIHGSATAMMHNGTYLALMHTIDANGAYATMAYKFEPEPPFAVLAVSRPLPMQGEGGANFASGLLLTADKVIVTYGAADAEARALILSHAHLESLFDRGCGT